MKQLTIRGFDEELQHKLQQVAKREGLSLNKAALLLLRRGAGLDQNKDQTEVIGNSLDDFIGSWSEEQERELLEAVQIFERIDDSFWS
jgi:hypothetical protein